MKKNKIIQIIISFLLILLTLYTGCELYTTGLSEEKGAPSSTTQDFIEKFDTTPLDGIPDGFYIYNGDTNTSIKVVDKNSSKKVNGIDPYSLPNCLEIEDNSIVNGIQIRRDFESLPYGQLEFYLYITDDSPWAGTAIGNIIQVFFNESREITVVQPNGTLLVIGTYEDERWNKVEIKWDVYTLYYKIIFNDVDLGSYLFQVNQTPATMGLSCTQGVDADHLNYVDNITFTTNIETIN